MDEKYEQEQVIRHFVQGNNVFVSHPIGSGKSLCYSLLLGVFDEMRYSQEWSIVIVVSPLVALMKDQVRAITERNVQSVFVGDVDDEEEVCEGKYLLVFISLESLLMDPTWRNMLLSPIYQENLVALVIDEAHCVNKW